MVWIQYTAHNGVPTFQMYVLNIDFFFKLFTLFHYPSWFISGLKYKLEAKDMDIKELKKLLKMKQEELSEMQVLDHYYNYIFLRNLIVLFAR